MDKGFHNDFERGQVDEYTLEAKDVGEIYFIKLQNDSSWMFRDDWFVDRVTILKEGSEIADEFPCYCWVTGDLVVFNGAGMTKRGP